MFGDFCLCFLLLTLRAWGSGWTRGEDQCQQMLLAIFTPSIRSFKGFCWWLERLIFLTDWEKRILPGGLGCFTCLTFSGRPLSELPLFNEPTVETGYKWQFWHNNPYVHHPEKDFFFTAFYLFIIFLMWFNLPYRKPTSSSNGMASEFLIDLHMKSFSVCQHVPWKIER